MNYRKIAGLGTALLMSVAFAACGSDKTTTKTVTAPAAAPAAPSQPYSNAEVAAGYKKFVNENARTNTPGLYVVTMTCVYQSNNDYRCGAEWSDGSFLSAVVTTAPDGSFIAHDVQ